MPEPRATIVVASHNRREQLLDSLPRHLALPERPAVVLVDNASTDGTADAVRAAHPEVTVLEQDRNRGSAGRTAGAEAAATPYVAFCDDDSWWEPGALTRAAELLDAHPRLALIQGHVLVGEDERDDPTCLEMARSPLPPAEGQPGHPVLGFIACAVVVRRDALLEVGGFPERFGIGGEEEIVGADLTAAGWQLSYVPEIVAHHHPPPTPGGRPDRREIGLRNELWTTWLRRPAGIAALRTVKTVAAASADAASVRGVARAVAGAPWILRERRVNPPHVEARRRLLETP